VSELLRRYIACARTLTAGCMLAASFAALPGTQETQHAATLAAPAALPTQRTCQRSAPGAAVPEPRDLRSQNGVLDLDLAIYNDPQPDGTVRYCYSLPDGTQSPTLRVHPGDQLVLRLKDELQEPAPAGSDSDTGSDMSNMHDMHAMPAHDHKMPGMTVANSDPCNSGLMTATSTNLHFHGFTVPPLCHQDDVLNTSIQPTDAPFEYRFQVPLNQPPGLYWYHPHIHGFSSKQVLGGASGALIVEGIERAVPELAGLPERVLVIRDQDLVNPKAAPSPDDAALQAMLDRDGDAVNTGTGGGQPAKDLSVNFVSVPYPDYVPARLGMKPNERQLWRVLNASSVTYLDLAALYKRGPHFSAQWIGVVAIDGIPLSQGDGKTQHAIEWRNSVVVSPGSRVEFIMIGPPAGVPGLLVTKAVNTGATGENDPNRVLLAIDSRDDAPPPASTLEQHPTPLPRSGLPWLGSVKPTRVRRLYFSERPLDPAKPLGDTEFYLTVEGQTPAVFDMASRVPNIVAHQGDVEDWIIENRSPELHAFHIHQVHFQLLDWQGLAVNEPFLRDTINVPFQTPGMRGFPSVRIRVDFRDPNSVGTYVYHCHVLDHEDGGMMGLIQVLPAAHADH
jgi:FtsP/CotA-like multicopper oxidase with cupredoxin domain